MVSNISHWDKKTLRFYSPMFEVENKYEFRTDIVSLAELDERKRKSELYVPCRRDVYFPVRITEFIWYCSAFNNSHKILPLSPAVGETNA